MNTKSSKLKKTAWFVMACFAILISIISSKYLMMDPSVYFQEQKEVYIQHPVGLLIHVAGSIMALLLGPFQFLSRSITAPFLKLHRWMGRLYLLGVCAGSIAGFYMSWFAYGGLSVSVGFALLSCCWLASGVKAYRTIREKNILSHRLWMIRNYSLTFAAVTLRLWIPILLMIDGVEFIDAYRTVAWLSWVPNLLIAEWIVSNIRRSA